MEENGDKKIENEIGIRGENLTSDDTSDDEIVNSEDERIQV